MHSSTYQFKLPENEDGSLGSFKLDIGKHVMLSVYFDNQAVLRAYTPIAPVLPSQEGGTFTLLASRRISRRRVGRSRLAV